MAIPRDGIKGLPAELLCHIFRQAIDSESPQRDLCRLSLVCRQWQEYVEGSAFLWTDISSVDGPTHVRRALEKSRSALIDLHFPAYAPGGMTPEGFLVEVGPHIARWRSLMAEFESPPSLESALAPFTTTQAPLLESLDLALFGGDYSESQNTITLFGGAPAPSTLTALSLYRIPLAVEPLSLSGLVSLSLVKVETISTPHLLELLRASPWLESLTLVENPGLVAIESQSSTMQPIELPNLAVLTFAWLDTGGTNYIISNIRTPNRRHLFIEDAIDDVALSALFTPVIRHILYTTITTADFPPPVIRVEINKDKGCRIQFRGVELSLFVDCEDQVQGTLSWLVDSLGSDAAECPVHLTLDRSEMNPVRLAAVPPPLVVKHLSISDYVSGWESLYTAMVRPPDPTSPEWLFAQMESLSVGFEYLESQKQLICMLRSRYGEATLRSETGLSRPMSLRSVELRGPPELRTEELLEEIRRITGGADVLWTDDD